MSENEDIRELLKELLRQIEGLREEIYELKKERKDTLGDIVNSVVQNVTKMVDRELSKTFKVIKEGAGRRVVMFPFKRKEFMFDFVFPKLEKKRVEKEIDETLKEIESEVEPEAIREEIEEVKYEDLIDALNPSEVADTLSVLASSDRLTILKMLYERDRYFGELEDILGIGPSSLSHHLSRLISAGLVNQERSRGKYVITRRGVAALILASYLHKRILRFDEES